MVMLPFTAAKDDLLSGRKMQTIRYNLKFWQDKVKRAEPEMVLLHMYWQNPRTRKPDCYPMGTAHLLTLTPRFGKDFTWDDAWRDGFLDIPDLVWGLQVINQIKDADTVLSHCWGILNWAWDYDYPKQPPELPRTLLKTF